MPKHDNPFDWSGGHPALDLVNTLDERPSSEPVENLTDYGDLVRFTELAGLIDPLTSQRLRQLSGPTCTRIAKQARELRELLHKVLAKPHRHRVISQDTLRTLTEAVRRAHAARVLVTSDKSYVARYEWLSPSASDLPLHACALAIEDLLVRVNRGMIRKCSAPDCDVYFVDTSKGHRRQWCSMRNCGNREKQRRWRSGDGHRAES